MNLEVMNNIAGEILSAVLNSFVFAAGIAAAAWALGRFVPRVNAATRHVIWWTVLGSFLAIPLGLYVFHEKDAVAIESPSIAEFAVVETPSVVSPQSRPEARPVLVQEAPSTAIPLRSTLEFRAGYLPVFVVGVWILILTIQLGRVVSSYFYLRQLKGSSMPAPRRLQLGFDEWILGCGVCRDARLLISDSVEAPMAAGFRRPAVIVPRKMAQQLADEDLDHVLLHELAHLARRDDWTNLIAQVAAGVFALHPFAGWILRRIDADREIACDDWVVAMTGAAKPYALSLARLIEFRLARRREMLATGIGGRRSQFRNRIERLLSGAGNCDARTSLVKVGMSLCALALLIFTATQTPPWMAFAQDQLPPTPPATPVIDKVDLSSPIAPLIPASPAAPIYTATPPRAVDPVLATTPHPPAPPLVGMHYAGERSALHAATAPPPLPRAFAFASAVPAPPLPPNAQAPPAPRRSSSEDGGSFLAALANAGYKDLSVDEIITLKTHGITGSYLAAMNKAGWGKLTVDKLVELSTHGVTPQYLQGMADVGLKNLTLQDTIELSTHGVRPEVIREITAIGFGPYSVGQIIEFSNRGVRPELFRALKDAGFQRADPKAIIEALNHGLRASDLQEAKRYGSNLTLQQIIRLKKAGVI